MGAAPSAVPTGNAGEMAAGLARLASIRKQAEELISKFQHGTEPYKVTLQIINSLSKIAPPSADIAGVQKADAQSQLAQMQKSGMQDMLQRNLSPGGGSAGGGAPSAGGPGPPAPAMPPALAA
jgi:hypothetical protein